VAVLIATAIAARHSRLGVERFIARRVTIPLLRDVIGKMAAVLVLIVGLYLMLKIRGTTQLTLTVLGGRGLFELVLGIAFRDFTENFLASVFLSVQKPFRAGDLVEIVGVFGVRGQAHGSYYDRDCVRRQLCANSELNRL
jgi:small conductance mechanosensitive channel